MREAEIIIRACNWGKQSLKVTRTNNEKISYWKVEMVGGYKAMINFYNTTPRGKVIMNQYWSFVMLNGELIYDNGFGLNWFLKRYQQTIAHEQSIIKIEYDENRRNNRTVK